MIREVFSSFVSSTTTTTGLGTGLGAGLGSSHSFVAEPVLPSSSTLNLSQLPDGTWRIHLYFLGGYPKNARFLGKNCKSPNISSHRGMNIVVPLTYRVVDVIRWDWCLPSKQHTKGIPRMSTKQSVSPISTWYPIQWSMFWTTQRQGRSATRAMRSVFAARFISQNIRRGSVVSRANCRQ